METYRENLIVLCAELSGMYVERAALKASLESQERLLEQRRVELLSVVDWKALGSNEQQRAVAIAALLADDEAWAYQQESVISRHNDLLFLDAKIAGWETRISALRSAIREMQTMALAPWLFEEAVDQLHLQTASLPRPRRHSLFKGDGPQTVEEGFDEIEEA